MDLRSPSDTLAALGHPVRLTVFRLLARRAPASVRPGEIIDALGLKPSTVSVYLSSLTAAGLVQSMRRGREIHYRLDLDQASDLAAFLVDDCLRGRAALGCASVGDSDPARTPVLRTLFICTGNSARSIICEAVLRDAGNDRFFAYSAGTKPRAEVNKQVINLLSRRGHRTDGLKPKPVSGRSGPDDRPFDLVLTVCDDAANQDCGPWPGVPVCSHWSVPKITRPGQPAALREAYDLINARIRRLIDLPVSDLDRRTLQQEVDRIAALPA